MKLKIKTYLIVLFLMVISSLLTSNTIAQKLHKCATMEAIQYRMQHDPVYKADYEAKQKDIEAYINAHPSSESFANGDTITIPVVVHIVLPNPYKITDENVDYFINRLNTDYSGFNDDSANGSSFYNVRGHSLIRFALARRDVNGKSTTGIERKVAAGTINGNDPQPIKTAASGLAPWDITKYYNLWVGVGSGGLLGIAPEIGPGTQNGTAIDGICCDYKVFANNPCVSLSAFAMARTSVHEIGHNMGLNHIFQGDSTSGCTSTDFSDNLSSPGMALPASLLGPADDTPPQDVETSGCPTQGADNGCTPSIPKMFQNYMDYTDDACYSMFTKGQVKRMHYVIEHFRPGYLTTKGHLPPDGTPQNEAGAVELISPGGAEYIENTCSYVTYTTPTCGNLVITPRLKLANYGVNQLNSITVTASINGVVAATQTFAVSVNGGRTTTVSLPSITLVNGTNVLKVYTSNPNNSVDSIPTNDTITKIITVNNTVPTPTTLPFFEGFENANFNPTTNGWNVNNANTGTTTWARTTNAFKTGGAAAYVKLFGYTTTGDFDYLYSLKLNFNNTTDSVFMSFHYAYKLKSANANKDSLSVEVTTDCDPITGNWTSLWKKGGSSLRTNTTNQNSSWTPVASEWTTTPVKVLLNNYRNTPIYIAFKTRNGNGQNIYIDDINIYSVPILPLKLLSFTVQQNTRNITCKWETKQEDGVKNYEIERSVDGKNFEKIGTVNAVGNSNNSAFYQFLDDNAFKQNTNNLYYRLKMNDDNGKYTYSNIVAVKIGEKQAVNIYPNPAKDYINIQITSSANATTNNTIQIIDYLGRVVLDKRVAVATGTQSFEINTSNLPKASYMVVIKNESEIKTLKFIKE